jgi:hypothetical protein
MLHGAVLFVFGAITSLVLAVVGIAMALVHSSETVGAIVLGLVIAGVVMLLAVWWWLPWRTRPSGDSS